MCSSRMNVDPSRVDAAHRSFSAAHRGLLRAIADLDESWRADGATSLSAWLAARFEVSYATARGWVRDAETLRVSPELDAALESGAVSQDQLRALGTITEDDPDSTGAWLEALPDWPISRLQHEARRTTARKLESRDGGRYLSIDHTLDERFVRLRGQLHPDEGALVMKAIDRAVPNDVPWWAVERHRADGLVALASAAVADDADPDRATVVVHVADDRVAELDTGGFVGIATAERLACDGRVETVLREADGTPIGIARASSRVPAWLYRQLRHRDRSCVHPGCSRTSGLHAHHIERVANGGRTDIDNLVLVCLAHHRLVHEHGWTLSGRAGPELGWIRPDGTPYRPRAPAMA